MSKKLIEAEAYAGLVDLCVTCAKAKDPNNFALHFYKNNQPTEDIQGHTLLSTRYD